MRWIVLCRLSVAASILCWAGWYRQSHSYGSGAYLHTALESDLRDIAAELRRFKDRLGRYPTQDEGLAALGPQLGGRFRVIRGGKEQFFGAQCYNNARSDPRYASHWPPSSEQEFRELRDSLNLVLPQEVRDCIAARVGTVEVVFSGSGRAYHVRHGEILSLGSVPYRYENILGGQAEKVPTILSEEDWFGQYSVEVDEGVYVLSFLKRHLWVEFRLIPSIMLGVCLATLLSSGFFWLKHRLSRARQAHVGTERRHLCFAGLMLLLSLYLGWIQPFILIGICLAVLIVFGLSWLKRRRSSAEAVCSGTGRLYLRAVGWMLVVSVVSIILAPQIDPSYATPDIPYLLGVRRTTEEYRESVNDDLRAGAISEETHAKRLAVGSQSDSQR